MKKYFVFCLLLFCFCITVNARDIYFTSTNGVEMSYEEYELIETILGTEYVENINHQQFSIFEHLDVDNSDINIVSSEEEIPDIVMPLAYLETASKVFYMVSSCNSSYCTIATFLNWKALPIHRSYDVFGMRHTSGISIVNSSIVTGMDMDIGYALCPSYKYFNNGFGVSCKLSTIATGIIITQEYRVNGSGTIYASYQHAITEITLANSKNYTIMPGGLGNVFYFYNNGSVNFDGMTGIYLTI